MTSRTMQALYDQLTGQVEGLPGTARDWTIQRTYAGYHQRSAGAWSWSLRWTGKGSAGHAYEIGSQYPATQCAAEGFTIYANRFGQMELLPKSLDQRGEDA